MGGGDDDKFANGTERPAHRVEVPPFSLARFPVTTAEYRRFAPDHPEDGDDTLPAVAVNWHEAIAYCDWLTRETGVPHRLPSESGVGIRLPRRFRYPICLRL